MNRDRLIGRVLCHISTRCIVRLDLNIRKVGGILTLVCRGGERTSLLASQTATCVKESWNRWFSAFVVGLKFSKCVEKLTVSPTARNLGGGDEVIGSDWLASTGGSPVLSTDPSYYWEEQVDSWCNLHWGFPRNQSYKYVGAGLQRDGLDHSCHHVTLS